MKTIQDLEEKCEDHRAPDEDGHPVIIRSSLARSSLRAAHVRSSDAHFFTQQWVILPCAPIGSSAEHQKCTDGENNMPPLSGSRDPLGPR